ncbi:hypothetical protein BLNAU_4505 [Blattamonas nauphoetae]|uniref:Uncharacterized protein n=1 Tax=Blattamonas nauphoetae TaxID=2049346 RepID=A0ABQ9YA43_9EUKA|nr:hypothetical protein BLNAU_4505 [Blattamonas nauphoetae]
MTGKFTLLTKGQNKSFLLYGARSKALFSGTSCPYLRDVESNEHIFFQYEQYWPTEPNPHSTYKLMSLAANEQDFHKRLNSAILKGIELDPSRSSQIPADATIVQPSQDRTVSDITDSGTTSSFVFAKAGQPHSVSPLSQDLDTFGISIPQARPSHVVVPVSPISPTEGGRNPRSSPFSMHNPRSPLSMTVINDSEETDETIIQQLKQENSDLSRQIATLEAALLKNTQNENKCDKLAQNIPERQKSSILAFPASDLTEYHSLIDPRLSFARYLQHHTLPPSQPITFQISQSLQLSQNKATWLVNHGQMAFLDHVFSAPQLLPQTSVNEGSSRPSLLPSRQRTQNQRKLTRCGTDPSYSFTQQSSQSRFPSASTSDMTQGRNSDWKRNMNAQQVVSILNDHSRTGDEKVHRITFRFSSSRHTQKNKEKKMNKERNSEDGKRKGNDWVWCVGFCDATRNASETICFGNDSDSIDFTARGLCYYNKTAYPCASPWSSSSQIAIELDMVRHIAAFFVDSSRGSVIVTNIPDSVKIGAGLSGIGSNVEVVSFHVLSASSIQPASGDAIIEWTKE